MTLHRPSTVRHGAIHRSCAQPHPYPPPSVRQPYGTFPYTYPTLPCPAPSISVQRPSSVRHAPHIQILGCPARPHSYPPSVRQPYGTLPYTDPPFPASIIHNPPSVRQPYGTLPYTDPTLPYPASSISAQRPSAVRHISIHTSSPDLPGLIHIRPASVSRTVRCTYTDPILPYPASSISAQRSPAVRHISIHTSSPALPGLIRIRPASVSRTARWTYTYPTLPCPAPSISVQRPSSVRHVGHTQILPCPARPHPYPPSVRQPYGTLVCTHPALPVNSF
ncbi:hypothetical protein J6590_019477 [Homalodisca vitripennis]|nr:hypothetical protein J6590_019477 [Homalodisca vitripennis]